VGDWGVVEALEEERGGVYCVEGSAFGARGVGGGVSLGVIFVLGVEFVFLGNWCWGIASLDVILWCR
jgi:hypothetical protein